MVADCVDVGPRLIDAAVDHPLAIERDPVRRYRLGIERELVDVDWLDQLGAARAGEQVTTGIGRVAHADMPECVEHAFVSDDPVGERELPASLLEDSSHGNSFLERRGPSSAVSLTFRSVSRQFRHRNVKDKTALAP